MLNEVFPTNRNTEEKRSVGELYAGQMQQAVGEHDAIIAENPAFLVIDMQSSREKFSFEMRQGACNLAGWAAENAIV